MAFGISPKIEQTVMEKADAAVAWLDHDSGKGFALDYFLDAQSQCSGKTGSCPDERIRVDLQFKSASYIYYNS